MLLPNKIFSYSESVISKFAPVLRKLDEPKSPHDLYQELQGMIGSPMQFLETLDALYALGRIDFDTEGRLARC